MSSVGKILIIIGLLTALIGAGMILFSRLKIPFLGKLPGDIVIQNKNFTFYFPITTCIIISVIISAILYLFSKK